MRFNKVYVALAWMGLSTIGWAQPAFISDGLVAYYPFNGNASDASGRGNHGTVIGAQLTSDRFSNDKSAYSFNGINHYISIPDAPSLNPPSAISVSAWIKNREGRGNAGIVTKFSADSTMTGQWALWEGYLGNPSAPGFSAMVVFRATHPQLGLRADYSTQFVDNVWHHLMFTYDGVSLLFYQDGMLIATDTGGVNTLAVYAQPVEIGRTEHGFHSEESHFAGIIDDVRIYNRALTTSEVGQLFAYESQPQPCIPHAATATATVVNGFVVGIDLTDGGCGYTNAPYVLILDGGGSGATASATIQNGIVTGITVSDAGSGYTGTPTVLIASPPFMPWLEIDVLKVKVTQHVVLGKNYVLESSTDLRTWTQVGPPFMATNEVITQEFDVDVTGRFFRIRQVP